MGELYDQVKKEKIREYFERIKLFSSFIFLLTLIILLSVTISNKYFDEGDVPLHLFFLYSMKKCPFFKNI